MKKRKIGSFILIISIIILLISSITQITGNVISENFPNITNYLFIIGLTLLFLSYFILGHKKSLDAIIIPTGPSNEIGRERAERAVKENEEIDYFLISGNINKPSNVKNRLKGSQQQSIYKELRNHGIKPSEMRIEGKSKDTIENVLNSFEKLKKSGAKDIGISSNPSHLDRFEEIIDRAKKEGIIDKDFRIYRLETKETPGMKLYGVLANIMNDYKLRKGIRNRDTTPSWISKVGRYIFNLGNK